MISINKTIKQSNFYDIRFELRNLNEEELLNKAAAQSLYIKDLEKRYIEDFNKIFHLEEQLSKLDKNLGKD